MPSNKWVVVEERLMEALDDWEQMQRTSGDEGAEWAERFERHFYAMMDALTSWYTSLEKKPMNMEELESKNEIQALFTKLPDPLQLVFLTELEDIYDGINQQRFD